LAPAPSGGGRRPARHRHRLIKLSRYTLGSLVALITSEIVFFVCFSWLGVGTTAATIAAFVAGAIPNWILNRRWTWQRQGTVKVWREIILYTVVSLLSLLLSSLGTAAANHLTHLTTVSNGVRDLFVTGAYLACQVFLWGFKFVAYEFVVFVDPRTSLHQVPSTTEANRRA
jgi:putative flippase GtrA